MYAPPQVASDSATYASADVVDMCFQGEPHRLHQDAERSSYVETLSWQPRYNPLTHLLLAAAATTCDNHLALPPEPQGHTTHVCLVALQGLLVPRVPFQGGVRASDQAG